ncbi:MAG: hypothetical protein ABR915_24840, partial [Thermoguttaceae bacterium]
MAAGMQSRAVGLRSLSAAQFEGRLWSLLGSRLSATGDGTGQVRRYRLALTSGDTVTLILDAVNGRVAVDGSASAVDACLRLVHLLDSPPQDGQRSMQVVPLEGGRSAGVQRAAQAILKAMGSAAGHLPMTWALFQGPPVGGQGAGVGGQG